MLWANRENAAAHGFAGGPWPSPTNHGKRPAKRDGHNHPGGRRAGCPHPAGPCRAANPPFLNSPRCGGRECPPYGTGETWRPTGQPRPRVITNLCRGRCLHCARRRVSEAKGRKARLLGRRSSRGTLPHRKPFVFEFAEVRRAKSPALPCKANALRAVEKHLFRQPVKGKRRPFLRTPFAFGSVVGGMPAGKRKSGEKTLHRLRPYQAARARPRSRQRPRASSSGASLTIRPLSS